MRYICRFERNNFPSGIKTPKRSAPRVRASGPEVKSNEVIDDESERILHNTINIVGKKYLLT